MQDENGKKVTEKEKLKYALDHLSESLCLLYETETDVGHALAFMVDSAVKYGQVVYRGDNVLSASADYTRYENETLASHLAKKGEK